MIYIRKFLKSDFEAFIPIEPLTTNEIMDEELAQAIEDSELAVTGIREGRVVGCGGVHPINEEQGEMWLRLSPECLEHKIDTLRWLKCGQKIIEETYPFKQLNATILCCFERSIKMIEWLGFSFTKELMVDDKKYLVYSKRIQ